MKQLNSRLVNMNVGDSLWEEDKFLTIEAKKNLLDCQWILVETERLLKEAQEKPKYLKLAL